MTRDTFTWPRTGFEFGQQYEFTKPLKHQKLQKYFKQIGLLSCFMFSRDKYALFQKMSFVFKYIHQPSEY